MTDPQTLDEAVAFARSLMAGDDATYKAGYSLENAAIAVAEVFGFEREAIEERLSAETLEETARQLGRDEGTARASWYFDGSTTRETYQRVLQGIEEGDPEILDDFPGSPLSGEWAGDPLPNDVLASLDVDPDDAAVDDLLTAYEQGFTDAVAEEIERAARAALA
jgi:hypothetical protein